MEPVTTRPRIGLIMGREVSSTEHLMDGRVNIGRPTNIDIELPQELITKRDEAIIKVAQLVANACVKMPQVSDN